MTLGKYRTSHLAAAVLGWWFLISWQTSTTTTAVGPFRSLSQCRLMQKDKTLAGSHQTKCDIDGLANVDGWWFFITGAKDLTLTSGLYPDQATCDQMKANLSVDNDQVSATCWPSS